MSWNDVVETNNTWEEINDIFYVLYGYWISGYTEEFANQWNEASESSNVWNQSSESSNTWTQKSESSNTWTVIG